MLDVRAMHCRSKSLDVCESPYTHVKGGVFLRLLAAHHVHQPRAVVLVHLRVLHQRLHDPVRVLLPEQRLHE